MVHYGKIVMFCFVICSANLLLGMKENGDQSSLARALQGDQLSIIITHDQPQHVVIDVHSEPTESDLSQQQTTTSNQLTASAFSILGALFFAALAKFKLLKNGVSV